MIEWDRIESVSTSTTAPLATQNTLVYATVCYSGATHWGSLSINDVAVTSSLSSSGTSLAAQLGQMSNPPAVASRPLETRWQIVKFNASRATLGFRGETLAAGVQTTPVLIDVAKRSVTYVELIGTYNRWTAVSGAQPAAREMAPMLVSVGLRSDGRVSMQHLHRSNQLVTLAFVELLRKFCWFIEMFLFLVVFV